MLPRATKRRKIALGTKKACFFLVFFLGGGGGGGGGRGEGGGGGGGEGGEEVNARVTFLMISRYDVQTKCRLYMYSGIPLLPPPVLCPTMVRHVVYTHVYVQYK